MAFSLSESSKQKHDTDYGSPSAFFVFIVGNCQEWPENREEQGDIAIYREYLNAGVPENQIVYLKDRKCSKSNCEIELATFLQGTRPCSTLVFYYGGHGIAPGLKTRKAVWRYQDIVHTIEDNFQGERVIYMVDCCAAGNLSGWVAPPNVVSKAYVCLASSPPFVESTDDGEEWIMNNCWIKSMRCNDGELPLCRVIEFMADRTALVLGDQFFTFISKGVDYRGCDWLPRRQPGDITGTLDWPRLENHVPTDAIVSASWSIGDQVLYKHKGGTIKEASDNYFPPGWLVATITSEKDDGWVRLQVNYPVTQHIWSVEVQRERLLNDFFTGQTWMVPDDFEEAQCTLARKFKYIDYSIAPTTLLKVTRDDGTVCEATVVDWRDFDWEDYLDSDDCHGSAPYGAHVPIRWMHNEENYLLPMQRIKFPSVDVSPFLKSLDIVKGNESYWARNALIKSIESGGKRICNAEHKVGTHLSALWIEEEEWYDAVPMDPNVVSLEVLATHAQFTPKGMYCPMWYEDGDKALSPLHYVRQRNGTGQAK